MNDMQWSQWIKQESRVTFNESKAQRPQTQPEMSSCKTRLYASDVKKKQCIDKIKIYS